MASPRYVPTRLAERTLADIVRWRADHTELAQPELLAAGRHVAQVAGRHRQSVLSGVMSCVEVFSSGLLLDLRPEVGEQEVFSWQKREKAWREHLGLELRDLPVWAVLCGFIEARNAILHGLGALTNPQLGITGGKPRNYNRREETLTSLRAANVRLDADRVIIGDNDVIRCVNTANSFVRELDAHAYAAQLNLPARTGA